MAANLLPLILFGGAAAYVVTQQNKLKEEKEKCPKVNKITSGEIVTVFQQAENKFKGEPDPSPEANYVINALLPGACNRTSKDSEVIVTVKDFDATVDITIPEFYMIVVGNVADKKLQQGLLTQEKYEEIHAREMEWYKKTTGGALDMVKLANKFEPLSIAVTKAMLEAAKDGGLDIGGSKGSGTDSTGDCPKNVTIDIQDMSNASITVQVSPNETMKINMPSRAASEGSQGNRDILDITRKVFAEITPKRCRPNMKRVIITFRGEGTSFMGEAPTFFYLLAADILEDFYHAGWYSEQEATVQFGRLQLWWEETMGNRNYPEI